MQHKEEHAPRAGPEDGGANIEALNAQVHDLRDQVTLRRALPVPCSRMRAWVSLDKLQTL
jgi:hypothetical protein